MVARVVVIVAVVVEVVGIFRWWLHRHGWLRMPDGFKRVVIGGTGVTGLLKVVEGVATNEKVAPRAVQR